MGIVLYLYRQAWKLLLLAVVTGLIGGLSAAAMIATLGKGIVSVGQLPTLAAMFFGLCLVNLLAKTCSELALLQMTQFVVVRMRISLGQKVLSAPLKDLQKIGKSELLTILTHDIDTFAQAAQLLPFIIGNAVVIIACLSYMAWLSWQTFIIFTVCLFVCLAVYRFAERYPARQMREVRERLNVLHLNLRGLIEGVKELQLNAARGSTFLHQVVAPSAVEFKNQFLRSMMGYTLLMNGGAMSFYLVIGMLVFGSPLLLPEQSGVLATITIVLLYLIQPIVNTVMAIPNLRQAEIALKKIQRVDSELGVEPAKPADNPFAVQSSLVLEMHGVYHSYSSEAADERFNLGPIDLTIGQGEIVFIVGGNGSGKTTLAMLLLGLYTPEAGSIRLNGVVVTEANLEQYRQYFSAVFCDFHLFEQILLGDDGSMTAQAMRYVSLFGMAAKVKVHDGKFSTVDLSTGQRKRLALISSYLEDRPIYLFDEWACDQDPEFKRVFYAELLPDLKARGKTVLAITHDDAYFGFADRILKLEDGMCREPYPGKLVRVTA